MNDHFFNGFADELTKLGVWYKPWTWGKKSKPKQTQQVQARPAVDTGFGQGRRTVKKVRTGGYGGMGAKGQRASLKGEGVFGIK